MTWPLLDWYASQSRDLPWRDADRTPWGVLVSEVMLQQTQVVRVEPKWRLWMATWPTPADLARADDTEVLAAWQGLGYPRRALRLHQAAAIITSVHGGSVPDDDLLLLALPGIGEYTASAVRSFAFGAAVPVLDTNVRRVLARLCHGAAAAPATGITRAERELAQQLLPEAALAPVWSVALMELGALVCTARRPSCNLCPLAGHCAWRAAGSPSADTPARRQARFDGSDRQARGFLLRQVVSDGSGVSSDLIRRWVTHRGADSESPAQAHRALASLLADGLLHKGHGEVILPGGA